MAKAKRSSLDEVTAGWVVVTKRDNALAFSAWASFRARELGAKFVPSAFRVPSILPPDTEEGVQAYKDAVRKLRDAPDVPVQVPAVTLLKDFVKELSRDPYWVD